MTTPIKIDVKVEESTQQYQVSSSDRNIPVNVNVDEGNAEQHEVFVSDDNIPMSMDTETEIVSGIFDTYEGPYEVTPSSEEQTLATRGLVMEDNVVVEPVPPAPVPANQIHIGTTDEWNEQPELVGEHEHIYIYSDYSVINGTEYPGIKVGDGETLLADLPFATGSNAFPYVDMGEFDIDDYDGEAWNYLNDKVESGFYCALEIQDGFYYFFRIERAGECCYQEIWCTEENGLARNVRVGWFDGEEWSWDNPQYYMYSDTIYAQFYTQYQVDQKLRDKVDTETLGNYYTDAEVDDILENNYYTSDQVDELLDGFAPENMIETTWANLVAKRDSGTLVKGAYYRITDYNFITTKANIQSGNHPFDIVVLAISESMLSESAYAVRHAGDHYYEREITTGGIQWLYTLYVDYMGENYGDEPTDHADDLHATDEFCDSDVLTHPVSGDDVPVLYKTDTDEYSIDDPDYDDAYFYEGTYEFDGDEYDMWSKYEYDGRDWQFAYQYALTPIVVEDGELIVSPIPETKTIPVNLNAWELKYCLDNDKSLFDWAIPEGKGVIYYLKDEFGNEAPYDFKNVMFKRKRVSSTGNNILNSFVNQYVGQDDYYQINCGSDSKFFYTFVGSDTTADGSLFGECNYTKVMPYILDGKRSLNDIVMYYAINSFIDQNCYNCTFTSGFRGSHIGDNCSNLLINGCGTSTIGGNSRYCTFVIFGNCKTGTNFANNIGSSLSDCSMGSMCQNNNYGIGMTGADFGSNCSSLTFGNYCYSNKFGDSVTQCTFGNYCSYNRFEGQNANISFTNYYRYNTIEITCNNITLNTSGGGSSSYVQYVKVCKAVKNITRQPTRNQNYEQIFYKTGRTETAV